MPTSPFSVGAKYISPLQTGNTFKTISAILFAFTLLFHTMGAFAQGDIPIDKDFGDLPDSYSTTGDNAPAHILVDEAMQLYLGDRITAEQDGQPSADAEGDTADDGVMASASGIVLSPDGRHLFLNLIITLSPPLENVDWREYPSTDVAIWIDWDRNGSFSENEFQSLRIYYRMEMMAVQFPSELLRNYEVGDFAMRVRLFVGGDYPGGTLDWTDFEGTVTNGEVEDYIINNVRFQINPEPPTLTQTSTTQLTIPDSFPDDYRLVGVDFGDLPEPYSYTSYNETTMAWDEDVAFHTVSDDGQLLLGNGITIESEAQFDHSAHGDRDDGVFFSEALHIHHFDESVSIDYLIYGITTYNDPRYMSVVVSGEMPPLGATLGMWIDWNHSGTFSEGEFSAINALEGANVIFPVPPDDYVPAILGIRFRLFDNRYIPGGTIDWQDSHGCAINGEIEDYVLTQPTGIVRRKNDVNHTTTIDSAHANGCTINGEIEDYLVEPTAISINLHQHNTNYAIHITLILTSMILLLLVSYRIGCVGRNERGDDE